MLNTRAKAIMMPIVVKGSDSTAMQKPQNKGNLSIKNPRCGKGGFEMGYSYTAQKKSKNSFIGWLICGNGCFFSFPHFHPLVFFRNRFTWRKYSFSVKSANGFGLLVSVDRISASKYFSFCSEILSSGKPLFKSVWLNTSRQIRLLPSRNG